jgi:hypothetical protein
MLAGLLLGDLSALRMLPRMLAKRTAMRAIRELSPAQVRALILENRISLRDLTAKAAIR